MQAIKNKAIVTVAINKEYLNYAINQYLCFNLFNYNSSEIDFVIITDCDATSEYSNRDNLNIIKIDPFLSKNEVLLYKLYIPELVPYERVIFLDADNLISGDISILFNNFENFSFVVFGEDSDNTNWRYDVEALKHKFDLSFLPRINGCLFYYNKAAQNVLPMFSFLKSLIPSYDDLHLARVHGNLKDDEILLSIGCSKYQFTCLPNDGRFKAETMYYAKRRINIIKGVATLWNNNATLTIGNFNFPHQVSPLIIAFDRDSRYNFDYILNIKLLKAINNRQPYYIKLIVLYSLHFRLMMAYNLKSIKDDLHFYKTQ